MRKLLIPILLIVLLAVLVGCDSDEGTYYQGVRNVKVVDIDGKVVVDERAWSSGWGITTKIDKGVLYWVSDKNRSDRSYVLQPGDIFTGE